MRAPFCIFAAMSTLLWHSCLLSAFAWAAENPDALSPSTTEIPAWTQVRAVPVQGDWRIFWNVGGGDVAFNNDEALAHGLRLVNLLNTYADYPGNPWQADDARSSTRATCGTKTIELPLVGRHTGIFEVRGDQVTKR